MELSQLYRFPVIPSPLTQMTVKLCSTYEFKSQNADRVQILTLLHGTQVLGVFVRSSSRRTSFDAVPADSQIGAIVSVSGST